MGISENIENYHDGELEDAREALMLKNSSYEEGCGSQSSSNCTGSAGMVYLSTFVAVAGSFEVGSCSGYSSPTQNAIREDLSLSILEIETKDPKSKPESCRQQNQHRMIRSLFRLAIRSISKQKSNSSIETPNQMKATSKRQHKKMITY
ncbi:hypothetical protein DKX38_021343 [Salix brachista]|uniref:Uncharacterized protein n=1 Tax=Salix brachista TaxID=2182728 RepID=A0A5N5K932_9ROSI|nr:hypothetical protein DKX38_021343 [Salix brachista]